MFGVDGFSFIFYGNDGVALGSFLEFYKDTAK